MSERSKVIWQEGLFLRPQHFQQQERYFESYVESRSGGLRPYSWGLEEVELEREALALGKLALRAARGVFPDGTPFSIPDRDPVPPALDVPADLRASRVFLALPLRRSGSLECDRRAGASGLARQSVRERDLQDVTAESASRATVEVGGLRTRLLTEAAPRDDFACIPMARVLELGVDKRVLLDDEFMPTTLRVRACAPLSSFLTQLHGLLHQRGDELERVVTGQSLGVADLQGFLRLQVINRYEPLVQHLTRLEVVHPEELFRVLLLLAGDLSGLGKESRRPVSFPTYEHDDLRATFRPTLDEVRRLLNDGELPRVVSIVVEPKPPNAYFAQIRDSTLIDTATFYLAAKADLPPDELRRRIPQQTTLAPAGRLFDIVAGEDHGLKLMPLPQLPPQIPYFANHVYFQIDRTQPLWQDMRNSGAFGLYVGGVFANLSFSMWAMRRPLS